MRVDLAENFNCIAANRHLPKVIVRRSPTVLVSKEIIDPAGDQMVRLLAPRDTNISTSSME